MSEHKSWLWRKRSTYKATEKEDPSSKAHEQEVLLAEKAELERDLRDLNDKLSVAHSECNVNDELAKKNEKAAQEALAGWEKAEAKALSLKQELSEASEQRLASEERTSQLEAALKECMQQLRFVREEQEQRIHDVLEKSEKDFEQKRLVLEAELLESNKKIAELDAELIELSGALFNKDELIEDLSQLRAEAEADIKELVKRAELADRASASLRYEVRVLEKELEIRNEEREFNRRTADAAHKQHLENSKKIAKLESECQRLRVLVRKRLPGPAALAKMKNEVDVLERSPRKKLISRNGGSRGGSNSRLDYLVDDGSSPESPRTKINVLMERLCTLEEDNNGLKETLMKRTNELQVSKNMYARTAIKLAQVEAQLDESKKAQTIMELSTRNSHGGPASSHDLSITSDVGSDDKGSCAGSWASALISDLEQCKDGKEKSARLSCKSDGASEINLMDDFVEMEKLALVCIDKPNESSTVSETGNNLALVGPLDNATLGGSTVEATGKEIVPVSGAVDVKLKLKTSISKLVKTIEGINSPSQDCDRNPSTGYTVRVFQWKTSELASTLQELLHCCYAYLNEKADFETFAQTSASTLDWILNHRFSLQDVSSMKDAIKKQFDRDESRTEIELGVGIKKLLGDGGPPHTSSTFPNGCQGKFPLEELQKDNKAEIVRVKDEMRQLESSRRGLEEKLGCTVDDGKSLPTPPLESQNSEDQDLNKQIPDARVESGEAHKKLSSLETETEYKAKCCKDLEAKCPELQLQIEGATAKDVGEEHINQEEEKQLQTDREITTASEKLAQCQETILDLGKQFKALAPLHEASLFEKVMSSPTKTAIAMTKSTTSTTQSTISIAQHKKNLSQMPSLLHRMLADNDDAQAEQLLESPKTKEIVVYASERKKEPMSLRNGSLNSGLDMHEQVGSGSDSMENWVDRPVTGSLAIVPTSKRQNSGSLFKKLLWRKKVKGSSKKMAFPLH